MTHAMARLKNPRDYAKNIAAVDNKAMGNLYKRAQMDPLILTRNSQLGAMDEEAQVFSVVGMILYPEEFDTVLYAAPSTQDKMCKRGISQRYERNWVIWEGDVVLSNSTVLWLCTPYTTPRTVKYRDTVEVPFTTIYVYALYWRLATFANSY